MAALMGPDFDLAIGLVTGEGFAAYHNGFTHSLLMAPLFAVVYAAAARWVFGAGLGAFFLVGLVGYSSHVMMDFLSWGRGVLLFWPVSPERFIAPFYVFRGVRHSVGASMMEHMKTVGNELAFGAVYGAIVLLWRWLRGRRKRAVSAVGS
jgi:membrane-bound metal-dependent hydrolase YbcI (DUF457 family)